MEVCTQTRSAYPQTIHNRHEAFGARVEVRKQGAFLPFQLQRQVGCLRQSTATTDHAADSFSALKMRKQILLAFEIHFVVNNRLVEKIVCCYVVLFLHVELAIKSSTHAHLGSLPEFLELSQELRCHQVGRTLPLDVPLAEDLVPVFGYVAQQKLVFVTDAVGDRLGSGLKLPLLAEVDEVDLAVVEGLDCLQVFLRPELLHNDEA
jgi:hypothetical protein